MRNGPQPPAGDPQGRGRGRHVPQRQKQQEIKTGPEIVLAFFICLASMYGFDNMKQTMEQFNSIKRKKE